MYKFQLPCPPQRGNRRGQSRYENYAREKYFKDCDILCKDQIFRVKNRPIEYAYFTATVEVWSLMDCDNLMSLMKWPCDWLKTRQVIKDDSPKHWWPVDSGLPKQIVKRKLMRNIYLEIIPAKEIQI